MCLNDHSTLTSPNLSHNAHIDVTQFRGALALSSRRPTLSVVVHIDSDCRLCPPLIKNRLSTVRVAGQYRQGRHTHPHCSSSYHLTAVDYTLQSARPSRQYRLTTHTCFSAAAILTPSVNNTQQTCLRITLSTSTKPPCTSQRS